MDKRSFLQLLGLGGLGLGTELPWIPSWLEDSQSDAAFWNKVRADYTLTDAYINLESGYYNIIPQPTLKALQAHIEAINLRGSHYMRNDQFPDKKRVVQSLAEVVGCEADSLILTRNTTESLNTVIKGIPWKAKDHIIFANQEYGAMQQMIRQVAKRFNLAITNLDIPMHPESDEEIVAHYEALITPQTRLILVSHMVNITGHILPIKKICDMAHGHGVEVLVDGAHCIGHFDFKINDLNCDYYGSSLHKWLATPLGCGLLYINPKHQDTLWPLFTEDHQMTEGIQRFGHQGTHPVYHDLAIENAITYYQALGPHRKEERLRTLATRWMDALRDHENIRLNTPNQKERYAGIANVGLKNMRASELATKLMDKYGIFTVAIEGAGVDGCRITPNVFTTDEEIDEFTKAMLQLGNKSKA
ncbi:MAG: aminotransferase class V-fold PLP-dependent enzyme [Bacteroidetes bacterium]|nr:aminotransferase class V-fold PLP-dependent enzyme [Bacteroidota bacterium]